MSEPFEIKVEDEVLEDLGRRLAAPRIAADYANADWSYGVNGDYLEELVAYWRDEYDWRSEEARINGFANYRVEIDGVPIHFIHERGKGPDPTPLILSHGWPWTFWDYHKVIGPLTDPAAYGGDPADSFDVVVPSLPGYGFSGPLRRPGIQFAATADLWAALMTDVLGYERFGAYGGDWGALVTAVLGHKHPERLIGMQLGLCFPLDFVMPTEADYPPDEMDRFERTTAGMATTTSHMAVQMADPQTLSYALEDSPTGLLAWILERRRAWSACEGEVERCFSKDELLTTAMIYWVSRSIGTSMRYYAEAARHPWQPVHDRIPIVEAPTGVLLWPQELALMPTKVMERNYNVRRITEMPRGGHFHPMEQPELLVAEIRAFQKEMREAGATAG